MSRIIRYTNIKQSIKNELWEHFLRRTEPTYICNHIASNAYWVLIIWLRPTNTSGVLNHSNLDIGTYGYVIGRQHDNIWSRGSDAGNVVWCLCTDTAIIHFSLAKARRLTTAGPCTEQQNMFTGCCASFACYILRMIPLNNHEYKVNKMIFDGYISIIRYPNFVLDRRCINASGLFITLWLFVSEWCIYASVS